MAGTYCQVASGEQHVTHHECNVISGSIKKTKNKNNTHRRLCVCACLFALGVTVLPDVFSCCSARVDTRTISLIELDENVITGSICKARWVIQPWPHLHKTFGNYKEKCWRKDGGGVGRGGCLYF